MEIFGHSGGLGRVVSQSSEMYDGFILIRAPGFREDDDAGSQDGDTRETAAVEKIVEEALVVVFRAEVRAFSRELSQCREIREHFTRRDEDQSTVVERARA